MKKKSIVVMSLLLIFVVYTQCVSRQKSDDPRGISYAGSAACVSCHKDIAEHYFHTGHYHATSVADAAWLQKLHVSDTVVQYGEDKMVKLENRNGALYQSYFENGNKTASEKTDIVFGSGEKALTFGYWKGKKMLQLPLTYLSKDNLWTNSPGFPMDHAYFTRPIISRCFECHASYTLKYEEQTGPMQLTEYIEPNTVVYGIDCERCHGPAAEHVAFQQKNPEVKEARFITSIKTLSRQQKIDMCGTCHSGNPASLRSIFAFKPGDTLSSFYLYAPGLPADVHGMQLQMLEQSKCYQQSELTCNTCHSPHDNEANAQQSFIAKCMSCHQQSQHAKLEFVQSGSCINCHMPLETSHSLDFNNNQKANSIAYQLRTHRIAIYNVSNTKR
ncbi:MULTISPECIES: multiheme c-type cytochrome [Chitinophagaceae]